MPLLISGIAALIAGLVLLGFWGWHLLAIIKAILPLVFLGVGVVLTYLGYEEYRENSLAAKGAAKALDPDAEPVDVGRDSQPIISSSPVIKVSPDGEARVPADNAEDSGQPSGGPAEETPEGKTESA